jgi:hypothetical protein
MRFVKSISALVGFAHIANGACIEPIEPIDQTQAPMIAGKAVNASVTSEYYASTGAFVYDTNFGLISRWNSEKDTSAILTFDLPSAAKGLSCEFSLYLEQWAQVCPAGSAPAGGKCSGTFALFSLLQPATKNGPRPGRDQYIGELQAQTANFATWIQPSSSPQKRACPVGKASFELVPTGSFNFIYFPFSSGAKSYAAITYS